MLLEKTIAKGKSDSKDGNIFQGNVYSNATLKDIAVWIFLYKKTAQKDAAFQREKFTQKLLKNLQKGFERGILN